MFWTLAGGVPGATNVLSVSVPDAPRTRVKPDQVQVIRTWFPAPQPLGVRVMLGATLKLLVPLTGSMA